MMPLLNDAALFVVFSIVFRRFFSKLCIYAGWEKRVGNEQAQAFISHENTTLAAPYKHSQSINLYFLFAARMLSFLSKKYKFENRPKRSVDGYKEVWELGRKTIVRGKREKRYMKIDVSLVLFLWTIRG